MKHLFVMFLCFQVIRIDFTREKNLDSTMAVFNDAPGVPNGTMILSSTLVRVRVVSLCVSLLVGQRLCTKLNVGLLQNATRSKVSSI